ncbi:MAG TPA: GYD domain-containing protein [Solirubrobacteraceae bacterium]|nr:GYD domain-containing protein [Solirubrobacteraceae bacterium]
MPLYLSRFSYTPDAVKALVNSPADRAKAAGEAAESLGIKLIGFWYAFGEFDGVLLAEASDNATMAGMGMLVAGSGALAKFETTALLTMDEAQEAMRKAGAAAYQPPG